MNAAFLLLTTAWVAGADAAPAAAPAVTSTSACNSTCCDKPSLLDKLRAKFAKDCCDAPKCEAPKVVKCEKKADPCDPCKVSILDKLRAKLHKNDCCDVVAPATAPKAAPMPAGKSASIIPVPTISEVNAF